MGQVTFIFIHVSLFSWTSGDGPDGLGIPPNPWYCSGGARGHFSGGKEIWGSCQAPIKLLQYVFHFKFLFEMWHTMTVHLQTLWAHSDNCVVSHWPPSP